MQQETPTDIKIPTDVRGSKEKLHWALEITQFKLDIYLKQI